MHANKNDNILLNRKLVATTFVQFFARAKRFSVIFVKYFTTIIWLWSNYSSHYIWVRVTNWSTLVFYLCRCWFYSFLCWMWFIRFSFKRIYLLTLELAVFLPALDAKGPYKLPAPAQKVPALIHIIWCILNPFH